MTQTLSPSKPSPWAYLWQMPLLLLGLVVFGLGLMKLANTYKPVTYETHVKDIQNMIEGRRYVDAIHQIDRIHDWYLKPEQQGRLELLWGDCLYLAQREQSVLVAENYRKAMVHYSYAERWGVPSEAVEKNLMNLRWGMSALALGEGVEAARRLEEVVKSEPSQLAELARPLVGAYSAQSPVAEHKILDLLEKLSVKGAAANLDDRIWALTTRIKMAVKTPGHAGLDKALDDARTVLAETQERDPAGRLLVGIGQAEFECGRLDEAKRQLELGRSKFFGRTPESGLATLLLGKIAQSKNELEEARKLYTEVITSHAGTSVMAAARLGRAEVAALSGTPDEQMKVDYNLAIREVLNPSLKEPPEYISREALRTSLVAQQMRYQEKNRFSDALFFLDMQTQLKEPESTDYVYRLARTEETFGDDLVARSNKSGGNTELLLQAIDHYAAGAEAYLRHARLATMDNAKSGESLWKAAQLFDKAGRTERSIGVYKQYVAQRVNDPVGRVPEGLHRIGLLYQSMGKFAEAVPFFQRNIKDNGKTAWAYASTVQLARCYMAQGEAEFPKAEQALLSIVQDNPNVNPEANEFRVSLFTLGELYYRTRRWSDAILRLEEAISRYPRDAGVPRATFWLADCYRKSAGEIQAALKKDPALDGRDQLEKARMDRLRRSALLFGAVIQALETEDITSAKTRDAAPAKPAGGIDEDYLRYAYLYRADCYFDLAEYHAAIKLYDQVATRFPQALAAVEAYVQIVNAYLALGEPAQAASAAERARWILKRIPDDAFGKGPVALSRQNYEDFLKLGKIAP